MDERVPEADRQGPGDPFPEPDAAPLATDPFETDHIPIGAELHKRTFVEAYATPTSKTFANGTQSARIAYPAQSAQSAATTAHDLLRDPHVQSQIQAILQEHGIGTQDRTRKLSDIMHGRLKPKSRTIYKDADGNVTSEVETESDVAPRDIARVIDLANRMDGTYERRQAETRIAEREYERIRKEAMRVLRERASARARGEGVGEGARANEEDSCSSEELP